MVNEGIRRHQDPRPRIARHQGSKTRQLACVACLAIGIFLSACSSPSPQEPAHHQNQRPNVILISLDTLRADHLGMNGYSRATSPFLDRLARTSILFENTIAQCSHTLDSHRSLFLSRYPPQFDDTTPVLAEVLKNHSYHTVAFTGGGMMSASFHFDRGFDTYLEFPEGLRDSMPAIEDFLHKKESTIEPFFLFIHTYDIHVPYTPSPQFDLYHNDYSGPIVPQITMTLQRQYLGLTEPDDVFRSIHWNEDDRQRYKGLYDGDIRETDDRLGQFFQSLRTSRLWDWNRDILIIFSDHGEEFWDHNSMGHGKTLFQELIHVPLIIRLPRGEHGGLRIAQTVELMDLGPTLLELLGIPAPPTFIGRSLTPLIQNRQHADSKDGIAVSLTVGGLQSIIRYPWKLIKTNSSIQLFNLETDKEEQHSLAEQHPEIVTDLEALLWQRLSGQAIEREEIVEKEIPIDNPELLEQLRSLGYIK